jgi:RimJ/RimL family protein N-acetyltransferase
LSETPPDDSFFDFKCPYCGDLNSFPTASARTLQECASCGKEIVVPAIGAETAGKLPLPASTPRLLLRMFHPDDSVKLLELNAQYEPSEFPVTETNVDQWIEEQRGARFTRTDTRVYLAVELLEGHELVGYVLLSYADGQRDTASFSLAIALQRRRQGLGLEAVGAVLDFAFHGLCVRRVAASCPSPNSAARKLLEKAGMRQEGEMVKAWFDGNEWVNFSWYGLLKEERSTSLAS